MTNLSLRNIPRGAVGALAPWTRIRADVVAVAPDVSGLVTEVLVRDNDKVKAGDVLFRVDPGSMPIMCGTRI